MARKYKNAKTSFKKLKDDEKIDFLFSKIDKMISFTDDLIDDIDERKVIQNIDQPKSTIERMKMKGSIKITYSNKNKKLREERMMLDKLFKGSEAIFDSELIKLFSQNIILRQTKKAPSVLRTDDNEITIDFPKDIYKVNNFIIRLFLELFIPNYFEELFKLLKIDWNSEIRHDLVKSFVKKSNLILLKPSTSNAEYRTLLKKVLGFRTISEFYWREATWDDFLYRILQIGAMSKRKKEPNVIEEGAMEIYKTLESKLLTKLNSKV